MPRDVVQNIIMKVAGKADLEDLQLLIKGEEDAIRGLNAQLKQGVINQQQFEAAARPYGSMIATAQKRVDELKGSTRDLGHATLTSAHAFQDFIQGGVGGILNNIPGLLSSLGAGAGLAGVLSAIGVAAYVATPLVQALWKSFTAGPHALPAIGEGLAGMKERLKEIKEELEKVREGWDGTDASLERHNRLTAESAELERKVADQRERQARLDALRKKEKEAGLDAEGGEIAAEAIRGAGGVDKVTGEVAAQLQKNSAVLDGARKALARAEAEKAEADARLANTPRADVAGRRAAEARAAAADRARSEAQGRVGAAIDAARGRAADLVDRATRGDVAAIEELAGRIPYSEMVQATPGARANQAELDAADMAETDYTPEQRARRQTRKERLKAAKKARDRAGRRAAQEEEIRQAGESTPEELRQSDAMEYIDANIGRLAPGMRKLTNAQSVDASAGMLKYQDAGVDREAAAAAALDDLRAPADRLRREAEASAARSAREAAKRAREGTAAYRLDAQADAAYETAAGIAGRENAGEFSPVQLEAIARRAAAEAGGLDPEAVRQAVYRGAAVMRQQIQADLNRQMAQLWQGGDSYIGQ